MLVIDALWMTNGDSVWYTEQELSVNFFLCTMVIPLPICNKSPVLVQHLVDARKNVEVMKTSHTVALSYTIDTHSLIHIYMDSDQCHDHIYIISVCAAL